MRRRSANGPACRCPRAASSSAARRAGPRSSVPDLLRLVSAHTLSRRVDRTRVVGLSLDVDQALTLYAAGFFPMDDPHERFGPLPFYAVDERAVFELDEASRARLRRRVRRSLRAGAGWTLHMATAFETVLQGCARPRPPRDGGRSSPRLQALYRRL